MADVQPLRGVRFDRRVAGPVGALIAPPYDVADTPGISAEFSIRNIESIELGLMGDDHALAASRYRSWLEQGVLRHDDRPAMYVHRHRFFLNGAETERTGLIARVRLADWTERIVLPHERTTPGPREERLRRLRAVQANLSPLYLLYRDAAGEIRDLIAHHAEASAGHTDLDQSGGAHRLDVISQPELQHRLTRLFAERTLFVADGHHRYEAALAYRKECRMAMSQTQDAPSEFVLVLLSAVEDPGVVVQPTHRLLSGEQEITPDALLALLSRWFDLREAETPMPLIDDEFVARVVLPVSHGTWDMIARPDRAHLRLVPRERGSAWRSLGVTAIEGVLESMSGSDARRHGQRVTPVVEEADAVLQVRDGRAHAAFLLPAPSLDRLLAVAEEGNLLPPKSTWFEPKAPAGLVISDLRI